MHAGYTAPVSGNPQIAAWLISQRHQIEAVMNSQLGPAAPGAAAVESEVLRRFRSFAAASLKRGTTREPALDGIRAHERRVNALLTAWSNAAEEVAGDRAEVIRSALAPLIAHFRSALKNTQGNRRSSGSPRSKRRAVIAAIDRIADAFLALDTDNGTIVDANPAAGAMLGVARDALGEQVLDVVELCERATPAQVSTKPCQRLEHDLHVLAQPAVAQHAVHEICRRVVENDDLRRPTQSPFEIAFECELGACKEEVDLGWWVLPKGSVGASLAKYIGKTKGEPKIEVHLEWQMTPDTEPKWNVQNCYIITVRGNPQIMNRHMILPAMDSGQMDWSDPAYMASIGMTITGMPALNAIEWVCNARPGIITSADLPLRAFAGRFHDGR